MKTCTKCKIEKPLDNFVKRNNRANSYQAYCKPCHNLKQRSVYRVDYMRNYDLNKTYGIGVSDFEKLLTDQGGKCAICNKTASEKMKGKKKHLCVDHCHTTGSVRGLLCDSCNRAIGLLQEDPAMLGNAISYLLKSR